MTITSRMPRQDYDAIKALNISRLKEMKRSPLHFRHNLDHPKTSAPLTLGIATHVAVLEPERYVNEFVVWDRRTDSGSMSPRRGTQWETFQVLAGKKTIITADENETANAIAKAVRFHEAANVYLDSGDPEVTLEWNLPPELGDRRAKGRFDWLTNVDGQPVMVGLKTARDCSHFAFSKQAAQLGYHWAWAYYLDGFVAAGRPEPKVVEIVVESAAPHAVKVYVIPNEIILQGREEYWEAVKQLAECERTDTWPAPGGDAEETLSLPSWAYQQDVEVGDIGLEGSDY